MTDLSELIAGHSPGAGRLRECVNHLRDTFEVLEGALSAPPSILSRTERLMRPFLIRSLLEVGCTCLLGRVDAFRLLAIAEFQSQSTYQYGNRLAAAFQWNGDVLAAEGAVANLWGATKKSNDLTRALLGDYHAQITLRPAFTALLDYLSNESTADAGEGWLSELRRHGPDSIVPWLRGQISRLYSATSKGVHHEFVISFARYYDDSTLADYTEEARRLLSCLALTVNFAELTLFALPPDRALTCFLAAQNA